MKKKMLCWEFFECNEKECPAYKVNEHRCWLIQETHCRKEIQGKFLKKMEMCLECEIFNANIDVDSMEETLKVVNQQYNQFRRMVDEQNTERNQAEEALRRSEEKFRLLINTLPSVVYRGYGDWSVEFIDIKFELLTGYDVDDFNSRKMKWSDIIVKEDIEIAKKQFIQALKTNKSFIREYRIKSKAGDIIWIQDRGQIVCNNKGEIDYVSGVFFDVTEHKQAEAERERLYEQIKSLNLELEEKIKERTRELQEALKATERANQTKSDFLASMSHELRTPLNAIIGFSEIMADKTFGRLNERQARYVTNILDSGRHLLQLINEILDLSKVEAGKMELETARVKLKGLFENSLIMIEEKALKQGVSLNLKVPDELEDLEITVDERKLKQILFNLLSNAVKFTPQCGEIYLSADLVQSSKFKAQSKRCSFQLSASDFELHRDWIQISVLDTGIGIKPEDQERIFGEFEQIGSPHADKQEGTGLGLALTRKLVELHEGRIWVESPGAGRGSRFSFVLPIKPEYLQADKIEAGYEILLNHLNRAISLSTRHDRTFTLCRMHMDSDPLEVDEIILRDVHEIQKRSHDFLRISENGALYLILQETDRQGAQVVCDRFAGKLESMLEGCKVSSSLATFPQDGESPDELLARVTHEEFI